MEEFLNKHKKELQNLRLDYAEDIASYVEKVKTIGEIGVNSNAMLYVLNLSTLQYEYVNNASTVFTGCFPKDFYTKGIGILPEIIVKEDFVLLSELFPKMNACVLNLSKQEKENVVFELYYKIKNKRTNRITQMVEYSSYATFDDANKPLISLGNCYEVQKEINGIYGVVRCNDVTNVKVLFEEKIVYQHELLTISELKIANLLLKGNSRKTIASTLSVSLHTINTHVKNIYKKLGINKVSELLGKL